jgi:hypothetical protein
MKLWLAIPAFASLVAAWHPATTSAGIHPTPRFLCELDTDMSPAAVNQRRRDAVARAAAVFSGKVVAVDRESVRFEVETLWKGDTAKQLILTTGMPADPDIWVEDVYQFTRDRKYLVYAYFRRGSLTTDACSRTMPVVNASDEIRELDLILPRRDLR